MNKRSVRFSVLIIFLTIFLGFGVSFVTPKPVRADALGDFIQRMSLGDFIRGLFGLPPSGGTSPSPLPPEPTINPAPNSPGDGAACFYNVKLINANGEAEPSAMQTGTLETGGCRTPGIRELVPSYYTQGSTAINRPEWPCTDATYVGQNCTQGIVTGQFVCLGGPAHEIKGCYNRTSGAYQRVSVTPLNPTNTPMPEPSNTPRPGTTNTPTPTLDPFFPSYCGCQATTKGYRPLEFCNENSSQCSVPDSRNGKVETFRIAANGNCNQTIYYCSTNGIPPSGNCNCAISRTEDQTANYPTVLHCLGRNSVLSQCSLPNSKNPQTNTGYIHRWSNSRCLLDIYECPLPLPTNTPMPDPTNTPAPTYMSFDEWFLVFRDYLSSSSSRTSLTELEDWRNNVPVVWPPPPPG